MASERIEIEQNIPSGSFTAEAFQRAACPPKATLIAGVLPQVEQQPADPGWIGNVVGAIEDRLEQIPVGRSLPLTEELQRRRILRLNPLKGPKSSMSSSQR